MKIFIRSTTGSESVCAINSNVQKSRLLRPVKNCVEGSIAAAAYTSRHSSVVWNKMGWLRHTVCWRAESQLHFRTVGAVDMPHWLFTTFETFWLKDFETGSRIMQSQQQQQHQHCCSLGLSACPDMTHVPEQRIYRRVALYG